MSAGETERITCPKCANHVAVLIDARLYCCVCGYRVTLGGVDVGDAKREPSIAGDAGGKAS